MLIVELRSFEVNSHSSLQEPRQLPSEKLEARLRLTATQSKKMNQKSIVAYTVVVISAVYLYERELTDREDAATMIMMKHVV